jgi:hypothetical protein
VIDCSNIDVGNYFVKHDLPKVWNMGMFNWWKAVYDKEWNAMLLVSPTCHLYSELWMEWIYGYDKAKDALSLMLYQSRDVQKKNPIKLLLKVNPLKLN